MGERRDARRDTRLVLLYCPAVIAEPWHQRRVDPAITALEPYKWVFIAIAVVFLALGFRHVYFRQAEPCEDGTYCARPGANLLVKSSLWLATVLVAASSTVEWWAPQFY